MPRKQSTKGVTLRSLSQQMMGMEQRLDSQMKGTKETLDKQMKGMEQKLDSQMKGMEQRLDSQMKGVEQRLDRRIDTSVHGLQATIGAVEARLINDIASMGALDRHETRAAEALLSVRLNRVEKSLESLQHLDARIIDIEVVQIPKLKKAVGIR